MKRCSKYGPVRRPNDGPEMDEAIEWFLSKGYRPFRVSEHQLKWGSLSYYPATGTVRPDDEPSLKAKGLAALERAMCELLDQTKLPIGTEAPPPDAHR